ncbi:hypothetical protein DICVIV_00783 [Dictyocaulus viviparus]|uniref:Uncharacterized protein n=1 Tax=Dictyocaulus viviparus TaxID=29172 RepID=A0A0D8Y8B6_DICVI|nr:hypothetical protein DICVIV_00783 [Dictyocaulus viviparus]
MKSSGTTTIVTNTTVKDTGQKRKEEEISACFQLRHIKKKTIQTNARLSSALITAALSSSNHNETIQLSTNPQVRLSSIMDSGRRVIAYRSSKKILIWISAIESSSCVGGYKFSMWSLMISKGFSFFHWTSYAADTTLHEVVASQRIVILSSLIVNKVEEVKKKNSAFPSKPVNDSKTRKKPDKLIGQRIENGE